MGKQNRTETDQVDEHETLKKQRLCQTIDQRWEDLLVSIRAKVRKLKLAVTYEAIEDLAQDILHDTIVQALKNSKQYDLTRPAFPWLRQIAFNQALMLGRRLKYENERTTPIGDAVFRKIADKAGSEMMSEDEIFGLLYQTSNPTDFDSRLALEDLLSLVKDSDREVLELAFVEGLRGKDLAAKLGISEGAAWMRQGRAIGRLREAYLQHSAKEAK